MAARVVDGKAVSAKVRGEVKVRVDGLRARGVQPCLAVVLVGEDPASVVYVRNKSKAAQEVGMEAREVKLPKDAHTADVVKAVRALAHDDSVDGLLVQFPLPAQVDQRAVVDCLPPEKDVDGFTFVQAGRLLRSEPALVPCTPAGVMRLLAECDVKVAGKHAVVVGRSLLVGKPMGLLLMGANATVTTCHSRTADLPGHVGRADIVIAAIGKPEFIQGAWLREGAAVMDVGINRGDDGKLRGDVHYASAAARASWITPVPGGVGPMTIAYLLQNTVEAAAARRDKRPPSTPIPGLR
ncbi:MAG: bifunctional methylenetetrahydrofolate dehydrogenase/methenyltetrahydrofolate cyclohydrolase FolD [Deltaproteobacteria bacterium]|nr:bifunctional methylenetetrahydrofolate dehydrogenase/methenyltetrahydrofolate cyclohydrolase FolD [Deltaproteobacteria bacterium]